VYGLRLWEKTDNLIADCETVGVDKSITASYRERLQARIAEQNGIYMLDEAEQDDDETDVADYQSLVSVKHRADVGRYMVVNKDVSAGTILMVEKAGFGCADAPGLIIQSPSLDPKTSEYIGMFTTYLNPCELVHDLIADPSKVLIAEGLCPDDTRMRPSGDEAERWDLITRGLGGVGRVNVAALNGKANTNEFGGEEPDGQHWVRVHGMGSLMNHSCVANVLFGGWGDVSDESS
jgi:hypothetical protein